MIGKRRERIFGGDNAEPSSGLAMPHVNRRRR